MKTFTNKMNKTKKKKKKTKTIQIEVIQTQKAKKTNVICITNNNCYVNDNRSTLYRTTDGMHKAQD